ncbi:MAG: hypothetical protein BJ554DRAFT_6334, partial [Olpidium bornovanus]
MRFLAAGARFAVTLTFWDMDKRDAADDAEMVEVNGGLAVQDEMINRAAVRLMSGPSSRRRIPWRLTEFTPAAISQKLPASIEAMHLDLRPGPRVRRTGGDPLGRLRSCHRRFYWER